MVNFLEHTDAGLFIDKHYTLLMEESDRGCILLGVSALDEQLDELFRKLLPEKTSNKRSKQIFDSRGAFGNLASKLDIAYVCHLLPADLVDSIHLLRKLRNNLAHQTSPFAFKDNLEAIFEVFSTLKGNVPAGLIELSREHIHGDYLKGLMEMDHPLNENEKMFGTQEEAIEYLYTKPDIIETLNLKRVKWVFVFGVVILAGLIIFHRDKALGKLGDQGA